MKNPDEQGETKSAPKEIEKLIPHRCRLCTMRAVAPMVVNGLCTNLVACRKRQQKTERATRTGATR